MSNILPRLPKRSFDYERIENAQDRGIVKTAIDSYHKEFEKLKVKAEKLVSDNQVSKARCIYQIQLVVDRGLFIDVCREELGLSESIAYNYASVGKKVIETGVTPELEDLLSLMKSAKAMNQLMNKTAEEQQVYIDEYQESGRIPSARQLREERQNLVPAPESSPMSDQNLVLVPETTADDSHLSFEQKVETKMKSVNLTPHRVLHYLGLKMQSGVSPDFQVREDITKLYKLMVERYGSGNG